MFVSLFIVCVYNHIFVPTFQFENTTVEEKAYITYELDNMQI